MLAFITRGCKQLLQQQHGAYLPMVRAAHFRRRQPRKAAARPQAVSPRATAALLRHRRP